MFIYFKVKKYHTWDKSSIFFIFHTICTAEFGNRNLFGVFVVVTKIGGKSTIAMSSIHSRIGSTTSFTFAFQFPFWLNATVGIRKINASIKK